MAILRNIWKMKSRHVYPTCVREREAFVILTNNSPGFVAKWPTEVEGNPKAPFTMPLP